MAEQSSLFPHPSGEQQALPVGEGDAPHPLDVPQVFEPATSYEVRDELQELIGRDLLGPWDGEHERMHPKASGPRDRYLVGMLGPTPSLVPKRSVEPPDMDAAVQGDASEAELPEVLTPQASGKLWASSMGLSFAVPSDVDVVRVTARWGRYFRDKPEGERTVWAREPVSVEREVRLDGAASTRLALLGSDPAVPGVLLTVEVRPQGGRRVVQLALVNTQAEPHGTQDSVWLFQTGLTVTALDGHRAVFLPIDDPEDVTHHSDDLEEIHLRLLYRGQRRHASGHNVAVLPSVRDGERSAYRLETTWLPSYEVPQTLAEVGDGSALAGVELSMDALATADREALRAGLAPLADGYDAWLDARETELAALPEALRPAGRAAVETARVAARRIRAGITLLTAAEGDALAAFRFANRAMASQRRQTEIARLREGQELPFGEAREEVHRRGAAAASWRPFQLAFVLLNLPALADPEHADRAADHTATVDLLFFPTGGGKTEAYLGLTAFTFAIRRLQGVVGDRDGQAGVAVLMRYTLRLLTAQQFQRAAALICAAEVLRRADEQTWGTEPFRIGLWVGGGVSPNWFDDAADQIGAARESGDGKHANVLQTLACPWCGTRLRGHHDLSPRADDRRVYLHCPRAEGDDACPFSRTRSAEGLPILTVDEEIYRYLPSLVIATVDKLAQLPWRGWAGMLFGRVRSRCPRHGYRHDDLDGRVGCGSKHHAKGGLPAVTSQPVARLRPPDLIIQDELHLISGALGTTVGLFEAAVAELSTWWVGGRAVGPKIIASTATTKRAREQVLGVFGRDLAVFPPPVLDIADTFFSRQVPVSPDRPGRRYLGVCAHGVRLKSAEIRLAEILLLAGQTLFDRYGASADPYMTVVDYFSATRELAGMRRLLDDDVATRVGFRGSARGLANRRIGSNLLEVQELTSRISSADISDVLKRLEVSFDPELDTSKRRRGILDDRIAAFKNRTASNPKIRTHPLSQRELDRAPRAPVDAALATSMLQVGVDVSRFGLMVVTGQPKNTAEYIQASSRVGRDPSRPGLVVTLYHWTRPRDLAHYEDFTHYHATFYRQVEALSVTPYARRAIDRGTAATVVAAVRHAEERFSRNPDAHDVPLDGAEVTGIVARMLARAEAIGGPRARDYLAERIGRLKDRWKQRRTSATRLGYEAGSAKQQQLVGLLDRADGGRWGDLTVGMSMRETENEINLLIPPGEELYQPLYDPPQWTYGARPAAPEPDPEQSPTGDDLGSTVVAGKEV